MKNIFLSIAVAATLIVAGFATPDTAHARPWGWRGGYYGGSYYGGSPYYGGGYGYRPYYQPYYGGYTTYRPNYYSYPSYSTYSYPGYAYPNYSYGARYYGAPAYNYGYGYSANRFYPGVRGGVYVY